MEPTTVECTDQPGDVKDLAEAVNACAASAAAYAVPRPATQADVDALQRVYRSTWWRHFKGGRYLVTGFRRRESDGEILVDYEKVTATTREPFSRPWLTWVQYLVDYAWYDDDGVMHSYTGSRYYPEQAGVRLPYECGCQHVDLVVADQVVS